MKQPRRLFIHNHGNMHCGLGWLIAQAGVTLANRDQKSALPRQWVECPTHTVPTDHHRRMDPLGHNVSTRLEYALGSPG